MSKLIVTTSWDDGSKLDLKLAELLEKRGIRGTFYIPKTFLDTPLERDDLRVLDKLHEVGAHTLNHVDLTKVSLLQAKEEIEEIKAYLEDILGHKIDMFCYPDGKFNENIKKMVKASEFIAARTCELGGLGLPRDPYQWHVTLLASNRSPFMAWQIWWKAHLWKLEALSDWENRAKLLFDQAFEKGGIYHLYGHSMEFERNRSWEKLTRVLDYISKREEVQYLTNGKIFQLLGNEIEG